MASYTTSDTGQVAEILEPLHREEQRRSILQKLYSPIQPWETRLICLQPGKFNDSLVTTLQTAVITYEEGLGLVDERRNVPYEALSYTWGGEILSHPLVCNGLTIGITRNCSIALHHLRLATEVRYLWVDAICIHQVDDEEKARQIRNLRVVFKRASQVVVWLGEEIANTSLVLDALQSCAALPSRPYGYDGKDEFWRTLSTSSEDHAAIRSALLHLAQRPWLTRAWVIQEICSAQSILVQCGRHVIGWPAFCEMITGIEYACNMKRHSYMGLSEWNNEASRSARHAVSFLANIRRSRQTGEPETRPGYSDVTDTRLSERKAKAEIPSQDLYDLLRSAAHLKATDPRDKIWALVGLTEVPIIYGAHERRNDQMDVICIDYGRSVAEVYAETTKFFLSSFNYPRSLLLPDRTIYQSMPSWSLDFENMVLPASSPNDDHLHKSSSRFIGPRDFMKYQKRSRQSPSTSWNVLTLNGYHIGTVCAAENGGTVLDRIAKLRSRRSRTRFRKGRRAFIDDDVEVTVRSTPCLRKWILVDSTDPERSTWDDVPHSMREFFGRNPRRLKEEVKASFARLMDRSSHHVTKEDFAEYLDSKTDSRWLVRPDVRQDDIIVHVTLCDQAYVFREVSARHFTCLGEAQANENLHLRSQRSTGGGWPVGNYPVPSEKLSSETISEHEQSFNIC